MLLPSDYDNAGRLRLPALFWGVLLLQARTWMLFVIAGVSRDQGAALLSLFYPDRDAFWPGLVAGTPAVIALLLSPRRQRYPQLWQYWRWVLVITQLILLLWQGPLWWAGEAVTGTTLALAIADVYALLWMLFNQRLRRCFQPEFNE